MTALSRWSEAGHNLTAATVILQEARLVLDWVDRIRKLFVYQPALMSTSSASPMARLTGGS